MAPDSSAAPGGAQSRGCDHPAHGTTEAAVVGDPHAVQEALDRQFDAAQLRAARRYTVRKQSSGYAASVKWYVYDLVRKGRVTVHAHIARESAQAEADDLNIGALVKDYDDDPRPYAERRAEAERLYRGLTR